MQERKIYISDVTSAVELVRFFSSTSYDADLDADNTRTDIKSILGVLANNVGKHSILKLYNAPINEDLENFLVNYRSEVTKYAVRD